MLETITQDEHKNSKFTGKKGNFFAKQTHSILPHHATDLPQIHHY